MLLAASISIQQQQITCRWPPAPGTKRQNRRQRGQLALDGNGTNTKTIIIPNLTSVRSLGPIRQAVCRWYSSDRQRDRPTDRQDLCIRVCWECTPARVSADYHDDGVRQQLDFGGSNPNRFSSLATPPGGRQATSQPSANKPETTANDIL